MPLGIALETKDRGLFSRVLNVAEFHDFVDNLLPHLVGLDLEFKKDILSILT